MASTTANDFFIQNIDRKKERNDSSRGVVQTQAQSLQSFTSRDIFIASSTNQITEWLLWLF